MGIGTLIVYNCSKEPEFAQDIEPLLPPAAGKNNSVLGRLSIAKRAIKYEHVVRVWIDRLRVESNLTFPYFHLVHVSDAIDRMALGLYTNHSYALVQCDIDHVGTIIQTSSKAVFGKLPSQLSREAFTLVANSLINQTKYTLVPVGNSTKDKRSPFGELFEPARDRDDGDGLGDT